MRNLVLGAQIGSQARQPSASDKWQVNAQRWWWWVPSPSPPLSAKGSILTRYTQGDTFALLGLEFSR